MVRTIIVSMFLWTLGAITIYVAGQVGLAYFHAQWISKGIWPSHFWSAVFGVGTALLFSLLWKIISKSPWQKTVWLFFLLLSFRWVAFDLALNFYRSLPAGYIGIPDGNDALLDSLPVHWHFGLKALLLIICLLGFMKYGDRK